MLINQQSMISYIVIKLDVESQISDNGLYCCTFSQFSVSWSKCKYERLIQIDKGLIDFMMQGSVMSMTVQNRQS